MQTIQENPQSEIRPPETDKNTEARRNLYNTLKVNHGIRIEPNMYLYLLVSAQYCGVIDKKTYALFSDMGISAKLPSSVMATNLRDRLLEKLDKEFGDPEKVQSGSAAEKAGPIIADIHDAIGMAGI